MAKPRLFLAATALTAALATGVLAGGVKLELVGRYESGIFNGGAAEIAAYHPKSQTAYIINGSVPSVDRLTLRPDGDGINLDLTGELRLATTESPTSVAVYGDLVAVAVHDQQTAGNPGKIVFFSPKGDRLMEVPAGSLPDMVTFSPDGRWALAANEGEPTGDVDAEGSVTIIDLRHGVAKAAARTADFRAFPADVMKAKGVRVFPGKTFANDVEPEYIAVDANSKTAWVTLQEANAIARIDIASARVTDIYPLGVKDHSKPENALDVSDKDGVNIAPHPVFGLYMPDSIAAYEQNGATYLVTANEGDSRDEETKFEDAKIDPKALSASEQKALSRIRLSAIDGDTDGDGDIDKIYMYGARSFSIWSSDGKQIYDSGSDFERITADRLGLSFNSDNDKDGSGDKRSPKKGPEPEGVAVGAVNGKIYAFIGLERVGGVMVYDVSDPASPQFTAYEIDRSFMGTLNYENPSDLKNAGDLGPEGITFVPAEQSPIGSPLLLVANEVSGTLTIYRIDALP